ncbi:MAG: substrate-binding domain-containing protein [Tepidisphaeraceae bacterium]
MSTTTTDPSAIPPDAPQSQSPSHTPPPTQSKPKPRFHWFGITLLALVAITILFFAGVFQRNPRVAMVTGEGKYWDLVIDGANEAARQYDVNLTVVRSKPDEATQSQKLRDLIGKRYDGVAISPVSPDTQVVVLAELANDTTVVTFDSDSPMSRRLCFVGTDNYTAGRLCGSYVRKALPDGGEVILSISNLDKENGRHRRQGVIDELLDRPYQLEHPLDPPDAPPLGDKYKVLSTLIDRSDPAAATEMLAKALAANPNVKCIVGLNAYSTPAILKALEQAQKLGQVSVVGFDNAPETIAGIEAGHVFATVVQDQFEAGFHAVRILAENARGDKSGLPMFEKRTLPVEIVDKENVFHLRGQLGATTKPST